MFKPGQIIILLLISVTFALCRKEFDHAPLTVINEGQKIGIRALKNKVPLQPSVYRFSSGDTCIYCTVTADESSGSFYRQVFVRDDEGLAIQLNLQSSGGIYAGDRIRINLNNSVVKHANGVYSLDSVSTEKQIVKLSSGNKVSAKVTNIGQIWSGITSAEDLQSQLVELNNVEFVYSHRNVQLGDPIGRSRKELVLTDCNSNTITAVTSGFSNFAGRNSPDGNGKLTAIVTRYNTTMRLELRQYADLAMQGPVCTSSAVTSGTFVLGSAVTELNENFSTAEDNSDFSATGWINYVEAGKSKWKGHLKSSIYKTVRATAFGGKEKTITWLISPPVVFSSQMKLSFKSGTEYFKTGHTEPLMAFISTNFDGSNFSAANWTALRELNYAGEGDGNYSGAGGLKSSGELSLKDHPLFASYSGTFVLAFRYWGEPGLETNVHLDDVLAR